MADRWTTATSTASVGPSVPMSCLSSVSHHNSSINRPKPIKWLLAIVLLTFCRLNQVKCDSKTFTNEFAVSLKDDKCDQKSAHAVADRHGFQLVGQVLWAEQQHIKSRVKRDNPNSEYRFANKPMPDPYYKDMWYLNKGALGGFDMNVKGAWNMGYTGKGIVVTILDDGIQPNHPDLANNYDPQASYDINDNDPDPTPQDNGDNKHGTRCAGEVAAEAYNEYCGVGIAFNASIGGVRMLDGTVTDEVEARALSLNPNHIDIYSASWGPEDDGKTVDGPGRLAQRAFIDGIRKGRHGKGSVFIWASGNGGRRLDNCNCDGYTNSIYTLSISSATQNGQKPWYLEECSSTLATTYSSGTPGRDQNVLTVDQDMNYFKSLEKGGTPDTSRLCTRSHTGTSASAPIAAAVVALALEANPTLTWRDLQHLVLLSSRYEPLRHESGWITNGVGRRVSHKFGYGLIDATQMVRFAENWTPTPPQRICETQIDDRDLEIPAQPKRQLEVSMSSDSCKDSSNEINYLEHVQVKITLKYKPRGSLKISLISPSGTISHLLFPRPRDVDESTFTNWPFLSVHFWGERATGTWKLIIQNDSRSPARSAGKLISWSLTFYGTYDRPVSYHMASNETIRYTPRSTTSQKASECTINNTFLSVDGTQCLKSCPTGQWPNYQLSICQICSANCETCFGPTNDNCLSCGPNATFLGYHCVKQCPDHYYKDSQINECLPCSSKCESCELSPNRCTSCKPYLIMDDRGKCVPKCQSSEASSADCLKCHNTCATCYGISQNQCLSCPAVHRLFNGTCIQDQCPTNYFESLDRSGSECLRCHASCKTCQGASHKDCLSCLANSTLTDGLCLTCPSGEFLNEKTSKCEACHVNCETCTGREANQCIACKSAFALDKSRCIACCSPTLNDIKGFAQDFDDCCHCLNGSCSLPIAVDKTRSVSLESDLWSERSGNGYRLASLYSSPFNIIMTICVSAVLSFVVIFTILQFRTSDERSAHRLNEYQKVSTNSSISFEKMSGLMADDYEEEDSLFEKT